MIIEIDVAVMHDRDALRDLERIALKIEDGWHIWDVAGNEGFEDTPWLRDPGLVGEQARELLIASTKRSGYPSGVHSRRVRVTLRPAGQGDLDPGSAARLAQSPLEIFVENRIGDGAFIRRVVAELDRELHKYLQTDAECVRIDSVGGKTQMAEVVERRCRGWVRPRLVVVVDSDQLAPSSSGATPSVEASRLKKKCDDLGVPCWVLAKREAENYLPSVLLEVRPNASMEHQRRLDAWSSLSEDQKDFYDMKQGLPKDPRPEEAELFRYLARSIREALEPGFGSHVDKCWEIWKVHAKDALRERGRGDLEKGLELLRSEV